MVDLTLPAIPRSPMYVGDVMTVEWQNFFRNLYVRVGGDDTTNLDCVIDAVIAGTYKVPKDWGKDIYELRRRVETITPPENYSSLIAELKKKMETTTPQNCYKKVYDLQGSVGIMQWALEI